MCVGVCVFVCLLLVRGEETMVLWKLLSVIVVCNPNKVQEALFSIYT